MSSFVARGSRKPRFANAEGVQAAIFCKEHVDRLLPPNPNIDKWDIDTRKHNDLAVDAFEQGLNMHQGRRDRRLQADAKAILAVKETQRRKTVAMNAQWEFDPDNRFTVATYFESKIFEAPSVKMNRVCKE